MRADSLAGGSGARQAGEAVAAVGVTTPASATTPAGHSPGSPRRRSSLSPMGSWLTERRLTQVSTRLRALRDELAMVDEQLAHLADDADDLAIRALVSETPAASYESNDARKHVDVMRRHRDRVITEIAELEARQDRLLDELSQRAR
jgi:hypothetical protein